MQEISKPSSQWDGVISPENGIVPSKNEVSIIHEKSILLGVWAQK